MEITQERFDKIIDLTILALQLANRVAAGTSVVTPEQLPDVGAVGKAILDDMIQKPAKKNSKDSLAAAAKAEAEKQDAASKVSTKADQAAIAQAVEEKKPITLEMLTDTVRSTAALRGSEKVKAVVESFGVARASQAPQEKWAEIIEKVKAIQ
jgi:hypothetical protein